MGNEQKVCTVNNDVCSEKYLAKGLCTIHYQRRKSGIPDDAPRFLKNTDPCAFPDCEVQNWAQGLCSVHLGQQNRRGYMWPIGEKPQEVCIALECNELANPGVQYCPEHHEHMLGGLLPPSSGYKKCGVNLCPRATRKTRNVCKKHRVTAKFYSLSEQRLIELFNSTVYCPGCNRELSERLKPHVDHDHACCPNAGSCGECVRGILCGGCNNALGCIRDEPETLQRLQDYLAR